MGTAVHRPANVAGMRLRVARRGVNRTTATVPAGMGTPKQAPSVTAWLSQRPSLRKGVFDGLANMLVWVRCHCFIIPLHSRAVHLFAGECWKLRRRNPRRLQSIDEIEALATAGAALVGPAPIALNPDCAFAPDADEPPTLDEA